MVRSCAEAAATRAAEVTDAGASVASVFDAAVLAQAAEAVLATALLAEHFHWKAAAGTVRQLFELLLNVEHLATYPIRSEGVRRYAAFGQLQRIHGEIEKNNYLRSTGRPVDAAKETALIQLQHHAMYEVFDQGVSKKGQPSWAKSWSGLNIWKLAESSIYPHRKAEYNNLFVQWSELTHAAPSATLAVSAAGDWAAMPHTEETIRGSELLSLGLAFLINIWIVLPDASPEDPHFVVASLAANRTLMNQIQAEQIN
jgi:hypothetical protein